MASAEILQLIERRRARDEARPVPVRPSRRADASRFPAVQRRIELDSHLLGGLCAYGPEPGDQLAPDDLPLLLLIARDRTPASPPFARARAIAALAELPSLEGAEALAALASCELEHESVRASALTALGKMAPILAAPHLAAALRDRAWMVRLAAAGTLAATGSAAAAAALRQRLRRERHPAVRAKVEAILGEQVKAASTRPDVPTEDG